MIYFFLALYLFSLAYYYDYCRKTQGKRFHFWLSFILMVCLLTFRYRVGGDTLNYIYRFENTTPTLSELRFFVDQRIQPIPAFIFSFCKTFFNDFMYVQAIFALFVNMVFFLFFKKNTSYCFTAIFLYGLVFFMRLNCEIMRESLAIAFFLLAFPYVMKQQYGRYYVLSMLSFLCHSSAVITFIIPLFIVLKHKRNLLLLLSIFIIAALYFANNMQFVDILYGYAELYGEYKSSIYGKLRIIIVNMIVPSYFLYKSKRWLPEIISFGVILYIGFSIVSLFFFIAFRFNNYFMIFYIIMVADYIHHIKYAKNSFPLFFRRIFIYVVFLYSFLSPVFSDVSNYVGHPAKWYCVWYPYYSVFNPQTDFDRETFILNQGK